MVRKMAIKTQQVKMQSALFWTGRYQTLYDVEHWYCPKKRNYSLFKVKVFKSYCQPSEKNQ